MWIARLLLPAAVTAAAALAQQNESVYRKVLTGTAAAASAPVPNIGQTLHLITVIAPAAAGAVAGLQIRIEASFDGTTYFPISTDITSAPRLGGITYQIQKAYGPWPFVRVRSLTIAPESIDIWYNGQLRPVVSYIATETDRFIL